MATNASNPSRTAPRPRGSEAPSAPAAGSTVPPPLPSWTPGAPLPPPPPLPRPAPPSGSVEDVSDAIVLPDTEGGAAVASGFAPEDALDEQIRDLERWAS